jgi:hypothetical protein
VHAGPGPGSGTVETVSELGDGLQEGPRLEDVLERLVEIISVARPMPLSSSVMVHREEVLHLLYEAQQRLPIETREARFLLRDREGFLDRARGEADAIVAQAGARAEQMVQRQEVVRQAEMRARQIIDAAELDARRLRLETEDYCDQRLASYEATLQRILNTVGEARARFAQASGLRPPPPMRGEPAATPDPEAAGYHEPSAAVEPDPSAGNAPMTGDPMRQAFFDHEQP